MELENCLVNVLSFLGIGTDNCLKVSNSNSWYGSPMCVLSHCLLSILCQCLSIFFSHFSPIRQTDGFIYERDCWMYMTVQPCLLQPNCIYPNRFHNSANEKKILFMNYVCDCIGLIVQLSNFEDKCCMFGYLPSFFHSYLIPLCWPKLLKMGPWCLFLDVLVA